MQRINISDYDYDLPEERIAQYPEKERDLSKLLVLKGSHISHDVFRNLADHIPDGALLVFNNSKVVRARLLFGKPTGARIEILCLEPVSPSSYETSFSSTDPVEWKCIAGNLKKWKKGKISTPFYLDGREYSLEADKISKAEGEAWRIRFSWNATGCSFSEVIEEAGHVPLPPYIERPDEVADYTSYQTIYSAVKGSVAAPTAGLHFSNDVLERMRSGNIKTAEITLHVGAGTFQPVKKENAAEHEMHSEQYFIERKTFEMLANHKGIIIPVGTTSARTLESIYWTGVKALKGESIFGQGLGQWEPYTMMKGVPPVEAMEALASAMAAEGIQTFHASTSILIVPGYSFAMAKGLITNFHQPRSTLLLLISAFLGERWKDVYSYALSNNFRFLSYGDSSLLLPLDAIE